MKQFLRLSPFIAFFSFGFILGYEFRNKKINELIYSSFQKTFYLDNKKNH